MTLLFFDDFYKVRKQKFVKDFRRSLKELEHSQTEKNFLRKGIKVNPMSNYVSN